MGTWRIRKCWRGRHRCSIPALWVELLGVAHHQLTPCLVKGYLIEGKRYADIKEEAKERGKRHLADMIISKLKTTRKSVRGANLYSGGRGSETAAFTGHTCSCKCMLHKDP